jgi:hypothetical protein
MVSYIVACFMIQVPIVLLLKTCLNCYVCMFMIKKMLKLRAAICDLEFGSHNKA